MKPLDSPHLQGCCSFSLISYSNCIRRWKELHKNLAVVRPSGCAVHAPWSHEVPTTGSPGSRSFLIRWPDKRGADQHHLLLKHFKVKQQLTFCWLYRCIIKSLIQYALRNSSFLVLEFRFETGPQLHSLNKLTHTYPSVMPQTGSFRWLGNITVLMANLQQHDP